LEERRGVQHLVPMRKVNKQTAERQVSGEHKTTEMNRDNREVTMQKSVYPTLDLRPAEA